jgi:tRNA uridine 5-carboxymethylaminomethyl modification enzyme
MKTGTPARLIRETINWSVLEAQPGDVPAPAFSFLNAGKQLKLSDRFISCAMTYTNERTHQIVMDNEHLLPQYDGRDGLGNGPRYCPSLYLKVDNFTSLNHI